MFALLSGTPIGQDKIHMIGEIVRLCLGLRIDYRTDPPGLRLDSS